MTLFALFAVVLVATLFVAGFCALVGEHRDRKRERPHVEHHHVTVRREPVDGVARGWCE